MVVPDVVKSQCAYAYAVILVHPLMQDSSAPTDMRV